MAAAGHLPQPVVQLVDPVTHAPLMSVRDIRGVARTRVSGLGGIDEFLVVTSNDDPSLEMEIHIDGGSPSLSLPGDSLEVLYHPGLNGSVKEMAGAVPGAGEVNVYYDSGAEFSIQYNEIEDVEASAVIDLPPDLPGDFNGDCQVDVDDLNLVLFNWNSPTVPAEWISQIPVGNVGTSELNMVLFGLGNTCEAGVTVASHKQSCRVKIPRRWGSGGASKTYVV